MTAISIGLREAAPGLLTRERIIAEPGFNRWLVPPAALAIHLCIGALPHKAVPVSKLESGAHLPASELAEAERKPG